MSRKRLIKWSNNRTDSKAESFWDLIKKSPREIALEACGGALEEVERNDSSSSTARPNMVYAPYAPSQISLGLRQHIHAHQQFFASMADVSFLREYRAAAITLHDDAPQPVSFWHHVGFIIHITSPKLNGRFFTTQIPIPEDYLKSGETYYLEVCHYDRAPIGDYLTIMLYDCIATDTGYEANNNAGSAIVIEHLGQYLG